MSAEDQRRRPDRSRLAIVSIVVATVAAAIDQGTKALAIQYLSTEERIPLVGDLLGLQLAFNPGAAMSFGAGSTWIFTVLASIASVALVVASFRVRTAGWAAAIGLVLGGAVGNLIDRLFAPPSFGMGHVTDMFAYGGLFIGNVADIVLGVGVALALIQLWRGRTRVA